MTEWIRQDPTVMEFWNNHKKANQEKSKYAAFLVDFIFTGALIWDKQYKAKVGYSTGRFQ